MLFIYRQKLKSSVNKLRKHACIIIVVAVFGLFFSRPAGACAGVNQGIPRDTSTLLTLHNYPLLAICEASTVLKTALINNSQLHSISQSRLQVLRKALGAGELRLALNSLRFTRQQQQKISSALLHIALSDPAVQRQLASIKAAGSYGPGPAVPDSVFIRKMTGNVLEGLGYVTEVYFLGKTPRYGKIDSISIDLDQKATQRIIRDSLLQWSATPAAAELFYYIPLKAALLALKLNERTEAIRYDPLTAGLNAAPFQAIQHTDFSSFKYAAVLVPGLGPELPDIRLTPGGKKRCRMALEVFKKGLAPFLIVSGGHVHPNKTPYCEAVEMKRYLVDSLGVAAEKVLIEPYARHTTTNLRNASRLIKRLGMPFDKPLLIVTDKRQSDYINNGMGKTAKRDLGYTPYKSLTRLSATQTIYYSTEKSMIVNPLDPLDP